MNKTPNETKKLISELTAVVGESDVTVVVCVPFTSLAAAVELTKGTPVKVGAQNCHFKSSGAYTGEISADFLAEMGVEYVVIGHSERRQYFAETDLTVNLRTKAALKAGLLPIVCVGESLAEREDGITETVVELQTVAALTNITSEELKHIVIAYEPVWAIGTGKTATDEQAEEVCGFIRSVIAKKYGQAAADGVVVQYGGSMNPKNAAGLLAKENIDGGLIGGASLKADDFNVIINCAV